MRIGILTVPFNNNYGGYLQSYALMTVLKRMGHEPAIIMRRHQKPKVSITYRIKYFIKGIIKTLVRRRHYPCFYDVENHFWQRGKDMQLFLNNNIQPQTKYIYSTEQLRKECEGKFDAYIVGSDQVWRPIYVPGIVSNMYLDFTEGWNVKRIAYAASFGTDNPEYTAEEIERCGKLIEKFDAVSVRERSGLQVINDFNWNVEEPQVVLDPTLLLTKDDYNKALPQENKFAKGKIFCYVLDNSDEAKLAISNIQCQLNRPLYEIADIQKGDSVLPSIGTWLTAIRDSDFVITDSFHGTVFSIIFNKPFAVYVNKSRGASRFEGLLGQFGLRDHIITDSFDLKRILEPGWASVNKTIFNKTSECKVFLDNALNSKYGK